MLAPREKGPRVALSALACPVDCWASGHVDERANMNVLITGGAGFIGSHVVNRFLGAGHDVRVLDNLSTGRRANLAGVAGEVELLTDDIRDLPSVRKAMRGCGAVVHLAALPSVPRSINDPAATHDANATG